MTVQHWFGRVLLSLSLLFCSLFAAAHDHDGQAVSQLAKPQPVATPGKIEVIEFFWYGCGACNQLEPLVEAWEKTLAKDVVFRREHALWAGRSDMEGHVRLFSALNAMKLLPQRQQAVFDAIHQSKLELRDEEPLYDWIAKQGINRAQFQAAYNGFGMQSQIDRAKKLSKDYELDGVPTFVVNGKFRTSPSKAGGPQEMFTLINQLIERERKSRKP